MKIAKELNEERLQIKTLENLTGAFEGIASMRIALIKNQVLQSMNFFKELWQIYNQIRVDNVFHYGHRAHEDDVIDKELLIIITAEGGFSGDIDLKLIELLLKNLDKEKQEIIVIGHHGAIQLAQRGVGIKQYYKLPTRDENINVMPIINQVQKYAKTTAFYQTYRSLLVQDVNQIELLAAVQERGLSVEAKGDIITEENYIFEPSTFDVVDHLERSMLNIALSQIILESKLAQYASRFRAMSAANDKAKDSYYHLNIRYNRAKRYEADERLKEIINGMRKAKV